MLVIVYASTSSSPASLVQTSRGNPSTRVFMDGDSGRPCTSVHCFRISSAFDGITVLSAFPCQTDTRGHGPRWDEAFRTISPHSRAEREGLWCMLLNACCRLVAAPYGRPAMIAPP